MTAGSSIELLRRVYFADTDAGGVAHHSAHVRWCEQARSEWLRERGYAPEVWAKHGLLFVVTKLQLDYLAPIKLDEQIRVSTWPRQIRLASAVFAHSIECAGHLRFRGDIRLACISLRNNRPTKIPSRLFTDATPG